MIGTSKCPPGHDHALINHRNNFFFSIRRQGSRCLADISETEQSRFMRCEHVLESIGDGTNLTRSNVTTFCQDHCPSYTLSLFKRLETDCDFPDELVCTNTRYCA